MQVTAELGKSQLAVHGNAITHHVQIRLGEVDDFCPMRVLHPGVANVPFGWNGPIEYFSPGRHLPNFNRNAVADAAECFAKTIAGDTPTDRVKVRDKGMHPFAGGWEIG